LESANPVGSVVDGELIVDAGFITTFESASVVLFDVFVPQMMDLSQLGANIYTNTISVVEVPQYTTVRTHSRFPVPTYGVTHVTEHDGVEVVMVPPNTAFGLVVKTAALLSRYPIGLLINYSLDNPEQMGYVLDPGQQLVIKNTALEFAKNLYGASGNMLGALIATAPSEENSVEVLLHEETLDFILQAESFLENNQYSEAYAASTEAWASTTRSYAGIRGKTENFIYTVPLLSLMLLPFVFLTQRLLFGNVQGLRRLAVFIILFAAVLVLFYFIHPGFILAASPIMTVIGFSTLILTLPIIGIIFTKFGSFLSFLRVKFVGMHEAGMSRTAAIIQSFLIGIENMRKRRLRTGLTLLSIVIMIMSIVSLTSISVSPITKAGTSAGKPLYLGIYMHREAWGMGEYDMPPVILEIIEASYEDAIIVPRAWKYTMKYGSEPYRSTDNPQLQIGFKSTYEDKMLSTPVLWGLTPQEVELTHPELFLVGNRSRWFIETDRRACILTEKQASQLGITGDELPVTISFEGVPFTVIGLISQNYALMVDLDTEEVAPIKYDVGMPVNPWDIHVKSEYTLIMPYQDVMDLAGALASVSVLFEDATAEVVAEKAKEIHQRFSPYQLNYGGTDVVHYVSEATQVYLFRWAPQVIMITLVSISVLNMMMGNVYQRKKHIHIYSTVGLSPLHISSMFLAETLTFALLGGVLGYISGLFLGAVSADVFQGTIVLNYASSWVLIALGVAMLTAMLSSIYPMLLASRLVTPSMERKWKMPTKPVGDMWEIPLPVAVTTEEEAIAILDYVREFCEGHIGDAPTFLANDVTLSRDEQDFPSVSYGCKLFPYELGITQDASLHATTFEGKWTFSMRLKRTQGSRDVWEKQNRPMVDLMREQLLLWKVLPEEQKKRYTAKI
jgi:ABC-type antimicrobial peptide transport system permease subunit